MWTLSLVLNFRRVRTLLGACPLRLVLIQVTTTLLGATSMAQLKEQIQAFERGAKEPLPPEVRWAIGCTHVFV